MSEFYVTAEFPVEETVAEERIPITAEEPFPAATEALYDPEKEKITLVDLFFQDSWKKNEEAFLRRAEELIMLRSTLHGYELKPFVPLISDKRTDVFSLIPRDLKEKKYQYAYTLHPGSDHVMTFETNSAFYSICGDEVSYNHHSAMLSRTPNVYDASSVWMSDNPYSETRDPHGCDIINVTGKEKSTYLFHRHTDGVVRAHCKYEHFRYNGLLFERKRKGLFGPFIAMNVRPITYPSDLENVTEGEILLLKRSDNYIFQHNEEWYECRAKGVYHVRSNMKTSVQFPGLYGDAYYYDGRLYVTTQNHRFVLYIFA